MRTVLLLTLGAGVVGLPAAAHAERPASIADTVAAPAPGDTTVRRHFAIPALPLPQALREYARQAGVRVELDVAAAAETRARPVSGRHTAAGALRLLLEGTGLTARFTGAAAVRVGPDVAAGRGVHRLTPLLVVGERRGYAALRSTSATRTDTPLRDTPQSVSVVTHDAIADQAMQGMADVVRYVPGVAMGQGEGHRDAPTIRGNSSTADFFVDGVRDDAQYLRDLYNAERVEVLKGSNATAFGRGGGGGVINRVTKEAQWSPVHALTLEGGSFAHRRATVDVGQGLGSTLAVRLNGVYEKSGGFRDEASLRRFGVNPTVSLALGAATAVRAGYEYFDDARTVDRGIPSYHGRPSASAITTFFGNPELNRSTVAAQLATATVEHSTAGGLTLRNRSRWASYDKFYQNSFPRAVDDDGAHVSLGAYNHAIERRNLFNQTDVTAVAGTGSVRHTLLAGGEVGRQETGQIRNTGYFEGAETSLEVPFDHPTVATPVTFRQSDTDADNHTTATVIAGYLQDQLELSRYLQAIVGLRVDRFDVAYRNRRTGETLGRVDRLLSPRAGVVLKPAEPLSFYVSRSVSYLPSAGDQFSSLTATSETLEPERFTNREVGAKWEVRPGLALTAALYRLDRTNTTAPDPNDPGRVVQTGRQRTTGVELTGSGEVTPAWQLLAGFASQRARIVSATSAAPAGAAVPLVPHRTLSLWNRYQLFPSLGVGLGVVRQSEVFAAIDNTVTLPGFTRADGALFLRLGPATAVQLNVENLLNERYYATSHGNNNIMPGAPRTLRVSVTTRP